ncbi:hypothetical protein CARUB_v10015116mg [Capsella rubella]|uniref:C2 domain-containing protein n=1 Tax=Capsella rubella TaxID=81985 RepID=R0I655_9BRAS|nr:FT-interacting protein 1 [Capsella rubella]EOA31888.1 hypothetical protein CARUB_v10015116mg [Capsella rubella]
MAAKKDEFSVKQISPKLGGERGARNPYGPTSSYDLVEQMDFLYVEVIQASNEGALGCDPIVEITLGNYKSSTKDLPIGPLNTDWNQVFAFDKTKGDVLSVTLKDRTTNTVVAKRNFKLAADIPTRVPPDARIAPQWYTMQNTETGHHMKLLMSVWFGTQVDEVYPEAWFSDASEVSPSCVINTRPKVYLAPRLCYVRVTIVSGHDLIPTDRKRTPSVYVTATLDKVALKTGVSSGTNPSWNQDLIFVASEPLEGTVHIRLIDRVDDQHEECIGSLKKKLSEMTPLKLPSSAPALFYDIEPPVKVEPAGDSRRFASRLKMKLATDQAYHVADECIQYASDYRAFAKGLWPCLLGKLEIGILGATGLKGRDEKKQGIDSYVVAKYGNKWVRTRTVVDSVSPKWNEQYSWDVYDKCTVLTLGVYDNRQITWNSKANDVPIGKVRIPLNRVQYDWLYAYSCPILYLGATGLKKMGEIQLTVRCVCVAQDYARWTAPFRWMLPKAHYKSPLSMYQIDKLRAQAVEINCANLAKMEPPLRNEVVSDMLKPKTNTRHSRCEKQKLAALCLFEIFICCTSLVVGLAIYVAVAWITLLGIWGFYKFMIRTYNKLWHGIETPPPPLIVNDVKLWKLDSPNLDELDEEFDSFPTSVSDVNVIRMRYDRLKMVGEKLMTLLGNIASQGERLYALLMFCGDPLALMYFFGLVVALIWYYIPMFVWAFPLIGYWLNFACLRNDLPAAPNNLFRRLPTNEDMFC